MYTNNVNQLSNSAQRKAQILKEFVTNDPYLAFLIPFIHDLGIQPLLSQPIHNRYTNTKIYAIDTKTITIEQNQKSLTLKISEAKKILESIYGPIPLQIVD